MCSFESDSVHSFPQAFTRSAGATAPGIALLSEVVPTLFAACPDAAEEPPDIAAVPPAAAASPLSFPNRRTDRHRSSLDNPLPFYAAFPQQLLQEWKRFLSRSESMLQAF